jgi:3-oxoacyl-[acyl-carrier-protein] synthase II
VPLLPQTVAITAAAARSALGSTLVEHEAAISSGRSGLQPLGSFLGEESPWAGLLGGWLEDRSPMRGRRYGAASNLAVQISREAVAAAGWGGAELRDAWIFAGSSRGNTCELLGQRHGRRPHRAYAASNSMHSEIAAAVSIELGMHGAWQMLTNGCSAGLDAAGMAAMAVASGMAPRALVVSVELPLLPQLLEGFTQSGLLSTSGVNDPYAAKTAGFMPGEAAAALTLEPAAAHPHAAQLTGCWWNSDAYDPIALPPEGTALRALVAEALAAHPQAEHYAVCPHATGTAAHAKTESAALHALLPAAHSLHLLKPYTGHTLGASGALDLAILWQFLQSQRLPQNLACSTSTTGLNLPTDCVSSAGAVLLKISAGMGGHNCLLSVAAH